MDVVINAAFDIISFGSIIVLVVLGLGIIASMMGIFNFAHAEFILLGAYTVYMFHRSGLPVWLGMLAAPVLVALFGLLLERSIIQWFYAAPVVAMLGTYAIGVVIRELVRGLIGGLYHNVPEPVIGFITVGDVSVSKWRALIIVITAGVIAASYLLLTRTRLGLCIRAALENPALARASGISTGCIYAITFSFGAALAGLAGALMVPLFSLFPDLGMRFLIQGFLAVMVGGIGTFEGPVVGAGVVGVITAAFPWFLNPVLADVLVFVVAIIIVKLKPAGLLSQQRG